MDHGNLQPGLVYVRKVDNPSSNQVVISFHTAVNHYLTLTLSHLGIFHLVAILSSFLSTMPSSCTALTIFIAALSPLGK